MTTQHSPTRIADAWTGGSAYEQYVGRWSRLVAQKFVPWLGTPPDAHWLDVGCGTGALTQTILSLAAPALIRGVDASEAYVALARSQVADARARFEVGDAQALPVDDQAYDAVVSALVLNFVADRARAVAEMRRAVREGGIVAAYVWDYGGKMQFMRHFWNAAAALDAAAAELDEGRRFPICRPEPLADLFRAGGLREVEVRAIDIDTDFRDFNDYWEPFLGGQGPAPGYAAALPEEQRSALRERLRQSLPLAIDGSVPLVARAWAVKGRR